MFPKTTAAFFIFILLYMRWWNVCMWTDKRLICTFPFKAFPETKPFEAADSKVVSTSNHWDKSKSNEVSVTFTLSSAAAKVWSHDITAHSLTFPHLHAYLTKTLIFFFFSRNWIMWWWRWPNFSTLGCQVLMRWLSLPKTRTCLELMELGKDLASQVCI